jgi:exopolyphosphatase/guanosine-5'-triphosphate,3'-diphosphate pyrophosphatase
MWAIATAACRDASNGAAFIAQAERICRMRIKVLSGKREAQLAAARSNWSMSSGTRFAPA